jgi:hypothetical protein
MCILQKSRSKKHFLRTGREGRRVNTRSATGRDIHERIGLLFSCVYLGTEKGSDFGYGY